MPTERQLLKPSFWFFPRNLLWLPISAAVSPIDGCSGRRRKSSTVPGFLSDPRFCPSGHYADCARACTRAHTYTHTHTAVEVEEWLEVWLAWAMHNLSLGFAACPACCQHNIPVLSNVWLFVTPWTVACQAPLSMGFSRQEYWNGLPFPTPGYLPNPGIEPEAPAVPALQSDSLLLSHLGSPWRPGVT